MPSPDRRTEINQRIQRSQQAPDEQWQQCASENCYDLPISLGLPPRCQYLSALKAARNELARRVVDKNSGFYYCPFRYPEPQRKIG